MNEFLRVEIISVQLVKYFTSLYDVDEFTDNSTRNNKVNIKTAEISEEEINNAIKMENYQTRIRHITNNI